LSAIQSTCPHILRYLVVAVIINKKRRTGYKDLVKILQQESYTYRDPITELIESLSVNFDFDGAQSKLRECEKVVMNDFFLVSCHDEFIESARALIFEAFFKIHHCIDLGPMMEKLNMDRDSSERWIVNFIRNARLDTKIDSKANLIIMGTQYPTVYQKVIEKTWGLASKTYNLANNIAKSETGKYSSDHENEESRQGL